MRMHWCKMYPFFSSMVVEGFTKLIRSVDSFSVVYFLHHAAGGTGEKFKRSKKRKRNLPVTL